MYICLYLFIRRFFLSQRVVARRPIYNSGNTDYNTNTTIFVHCITRLDGKSGRVWTIYSHSDLPKGWRRVRLPMRMQRQFESNIKLQSPNLDLYLFLAELDIKVNIQYMILILPRKKPVFFKEYGPDRTSSSLCLNFKSSQIFL